MKVFKDGILRESTVLFVLNMLASVLNYACQLLMAKVLSVESFGTINTIFSFMLVVGVPGTTLTMMVSKYYAELPDDCAAEQRIGYIARIVSFVTICAAALFALCVVVMKPLASILVITDTVTLLLAFALGAMGFYQPLYSGVFSGNRRFVAVGIYALFIPVYKLIAIFAARFLFEDDLARLYAILWMMVAGTVLTAVAGHWKTRRIVGKFSAREKTQYRIKFSAEDMNTLFLNICLMVYMNIDLLVVRYYGQESESGLYSAVLLFGRVIYYFATTLGTILLPLAASCKGQRSEQRKLFHKVMGLMLIFTACCILPFNIGGSFLIKLLYGTAYIGAQQYIKYVSLIASALSICTILINYLVGIGKTKFATGVMTVVNMLILLLVMLENRVEIILVGIGVIGLAGAVVIYIRSISEKMDQ